MWGGILTSGFSYDIFRLFAECNLDEKELRREMDNIINLVPSSRSEQKNFFEQFKSSSYTRFDIYFKNEDWRRDYWFCQTGDEMRLSLDFKKEARFIIQWSSAKYIITLSFSNCSITREYEIAVVSGGKGSYTFSTCGNEARSRLYEISDYYEQFGFSFENAIDEIVKVCEQGKTGRFTIRRNNDKDQKIIEKKSDDNFGYSNLLDFEEEHRSAFFSLKYRISAALAGVFTQVAIDKLEKDDFAGLAKLSREYVGGKTSFDLDSEHLQDLIAYTFIGAMKVYSNSEKINDFIYDIQRYINNHSNNVSKTLYTLIKSALNLTLYSNGMTVMIAVLLSKGVLQESNILQIFENQGFSNSINDYLQIKNEKDSTQESELKKKMLISLKVLNLEEGVSLEEIKKAYHVMAMKFHPDRLEGKEIDPDFIQLANQKLQEINEAYDFLVEYFS